MSSRKKTDVCDAQWSQQLPTAGNLARIVSAMITTGQADEEKEAFKVTPSAPAKRLQHLQKQAPALNLPLVPA